MPVSWLLDLEMLSALLCLYCSYLYSHADKRWVPFFAFLFRITSKSWTCIIILRNYIPRTRDSRSFVVAVIAVTYQCLQISYLLLPLPAQSKVYSEIFGTLPVSLLQTQLICRKYTYIYWLNKYTEWSKNI